MSQIDALMAVVMSRQVRNGDFISNGASTPLAAASLYLAIEHHAPEAEFWLLGCLSPTNRSLIDAIVAPEKVYATARAYMSQREVVNYEARGNGTCHFVRPAQIDAFGNVNASRIVLPGGDVLRFHGIGVGDVVNAIQGTCMYVTEHTPRVFVEKLDFRTGAGNLDGSDWRTRAGLEGRGPACVVTPLGVLMFGTDGRLVVHSTHAGVSVEQIQAQTGFDIEPGPDLHVTPEPTADELAALERVDPHGLRRLEFREMRQQVMHLLT